MRSSGSIQIWLILGFFLLANLQLNWADDAADQQKFREECIKEMGNLTPDEIKRINDKKVVTKEKQDASRNLQCFLQCMYKKNGIIGPDGKDNPEAFMKYINNIITNKAKIAPILRSCASKRSSDVCATIYNFESCIMEQA